MLEFTIKANLEDYNFFLATQKELYSKNIITALYKGNNYISFSFATKQKQKLKHIIIKIITNFIVVKFKLKFFKLNLKFNNLNANYIKTLINALTIFDLENDEFEIEKNINLFKEININSFYYFKLKSIRENWKQICNLTNINSHLFFTNKTILDLIKYLINNTKNKVDVVNVTYKNKDYLVKNKTKNLKNVIVENNINLNLVTNLMYYNPTKIIIDCLNRVDSDYLLIINTIFKNNIVQQNYKNI